MIPSAKTIVTTMVLVILTMAVVARVKPLREFVAAG